MTDEEEDKETPKEKKFGDFLWSRGPMTTFDLLFEPITYAVIGIGILVWQLIINR